MKTSDGTEIVRRRIYWLVQGSDRPIDPMPVQLVKVQVKILSPRVWFNVQEVDCTSDLSIRSFRIQKEVQGRLYKDKKKAARRAININRKKVAGT